MIKQLSSLSEEEFLASCQKLKGRRKLLEGYGDYVHKRLELYPQTSSAHMHDLLKEAFLTLLPSVRKRFTIMCSMCDRFMICLWKNGGDFQMVAELPFGQQAQVVFGF